MSLGRVVVVPLASPTTAPWLGRLAAMVARPDGGTVVPVSVATPGQDAAATAVAKRAVDLAAHAARDLGVEARAEVVHGQRVPTAVLDAVDVHDASLVVMGWQGESTSHNVFGELIDSIMGRSRVPLAVVRPAVDEFGRVLLPLGDDHLSASGRRGVDLAVELAERLRAATTSSLLVVRSGDPDLPLPDALQTGSVPTVRSEVDIPRALEHVSRTGDIVVTPVAPTADGLRNATTHIAWATPRCWQLVAIDVGPAQPVDVVTAVKDAGMLVEPRPEQEEDVPHVVEVAMTVPGDVDDAWPRIATAVRLVGSVLGHRVRAGEDGTQVIVGTVEVRATSPAAALSAIMVELDDARWQIGATSLDYRLVDGDSG
ncbi:universal stress protein [Euzebya sp.]|uniref:universal stress protein n=1 Tax=Euzebya sp. TaxID=1971409 RepID=UPI003517C492